jgi:hypothetical protein
METSIIASSAHTANIVQKWCEDNLTDFIPKDEWPPSSPDLNPLILFIGGNMLGQLRNYKYANCPNSRKLSNGFGPMYRNMWYVSRAMLLISTFAS